jgi:hypothetical protein
VFYNGNPERLDIVTDLFMQEQIPNKHNRMPGTPAEMMAR